MIGGLLKELWIHHILPFVSPIDLVNVSLTAKDLNYLVQTNFKKEIDYWKELALNLQKNDGMLEAAKKGHEDLVKLFVKQGANYWNDGLYGAAQGGNLRLVEFFIQKGANNWDWGLYGAAKGGHSRLIEFFIQKRANDWNWGLCAAAEGGHLKLIEFFIQK